LYSFYYGPKSRRAIIKNFGGKRNYQAIQKGEADMKMYAFNNLIFTNKNERQPKYQLNYLTGEKYLHQSLFCAFSFYEFLSPEARPDFLINFYDDGSLCPSTLDMLKTNFPSIHVISSEHTAQKFNRLLPADKYPHLHKKRAMYPHIRKLTDIHLGSQGWQLVLDSDMLFFDRPSQLLAWLKKPEAPFLLFDPISSYHYSFGLMEGLTGNTVHPHLNVGIAGLKSEDINWDQVEHWIAALEKKEGTSYLLEQALTAMLCAGKEIIIADKDQYLVKPDKKDVEHLQTTLHHYVAESKEWYYKMAWKHIINDNR